MILSTQARPLLEARNLHKSFRRRDALAVDALRGADLTICAGDRISILGKSGAGKSTLLHVLGTLELPTKGTLLYEGRNLMKYSENALSQFRNRTLGFVFQFHYLMHEFNALENVMMPALISGRSRSEATRRASELLDRVGLRDRITHRPAQLSGGEQQRVAIARALMMRPQILLTDEMTGNLDAATGAKILDLIQELHTETGAAIVSVTHDEALGRSYPKCFRLENGLLKRVTS